MKKEVLNVLRLLSLFLFLAVVVVIAGETMFFIPNGNRTTNPDYVVPIINQPTNKRVFGTS